jgi:PAS domain S-box-containing protein
LNEIIIDSNSEEKDKFRNLIELAADGILIGSHEGIVLEANSCFCSLLEMTKSELVGSFVGDLPFTKESVEQFPFQFDSLKNGEIVISERELLRSDNTLVTIEMRTKMMPDGTYQSIYRDISERKKNEIQLLDYANELSKLNADKDRFISILAHDLVSPFNSILGYLDLLTSNIKEFEKDQIEKHILTIQGSANRTYNLLQDILAWSRSHSGSMPYEPDQCIIKDISNKVVEILNPIAINKEITIKNLVTSSISAYADVNMLRTILRNLISNAIKFTKPKGQIRIVAKFENQAIIISVIDTGHGIPKNKIPDLFNDLQLKSTDGTSNEKGSGLGLIISKLLVEKHGGTIWVESKIGKGSTFSFSLPAYEKSL